jgi:hypothetical protein
MFVCIRIVCILDPESGGRTFLINTDTHLSICATLILQEKTVLIFGVLITLNLTVFYALLFA